MSISSRLPGWHRSLTAVHTSHHAALYTQDSSRYALHDAAVSCLPACTDCTSSTTIRDCAAADTMGLWPFSKKEEPAAPLADKPKKKICCACPDTKRLRDECIATNGEEHPYCQSLIEAHKQCLRMEGFNI